MKRTPLKRKTPLRANLEKTREWERRSRKPLPARSARIIAKAPVRAAVRREVHARDQTCVAAEIVPEVVCWHPYGEPLDVDEIAPRGINPDGELDPENCQLLCRAHHDWKGSYPEEAERRGLRRKAPPLDVITPL